MPLLLTHQQQNISLQFPSTSGNGFVSHSKPNHLCDQEEEETRWLQEGGPNTAWTQERSKAYSLTHIFPLNDT